AVRCRWFVPLCCLKRREKKPGLNRFLRTGKQGTRCITRESLRLKAPSIARVTSVLAAVHLWSTRIFAKKVAKEECLRSLWLLWQKVTAEGCILLLMKNKSFLRRLTSRSSILKVNWPIIRDT